MPCRATSGRECDERRNEFGHPEIGSLDLRAEPEPDDDQLGRRHDDETLAIMPLGPVGCLLYTSRCV